jgi:hypothetical protein
MEQTEQKRIDIYVPECREKFAEWIKSRGGVARWRNINLSNPDAGDQYTPALTDGKETGKPHWSVEYAETITDLSRFRFVKELKEVKRFHVAVHSAFLSFKLTDASSRKIRKMCAKYSTPEAPASYHFDYETQECVITVPVWEN